jgi:two-component system, sensor histidine kinase and response regulator
MKFFNDISIKQKLMRIIVMTCGVAMLLSYFAILLHEAISFNDDVRQELTSLADIVGNNTSAAIMFNDPKAATETLSGLKDKKNILAAYILSANDTVFAEYIASDTSPERLKFERLKEGDPSSNVRQTLSEMIANKNAFFNFNRDIIIINKITSEGQTLGTLVIQSDTDQFVARLKGFFVVLTLIMMLTFLSAYLLSSRLQKIITEPILNLSKEMKRVSQEKDYSIRAEKESNDEVGSLIDGFNDMLNQIQVRDEELREHKEQLEELVAFRTEELSLTNQNLQHTVEQLQEAKEAAEEASRAKSRFLANMSHEIRTPLNGVLGMTDLLLNSAVTEKQRRFAETIRLSGQTLLDVINDILDFSKIEAGKLELENIDFNLRETIEDIVGILANMAQRKNIELISNIHPDVPSSVKGDPGRLGQIISNLVSNAIKFTEKGEIEVKVNVLPGESDMGIVRFEVRDTGIGISPDGRKRIFDAFAQEDDSTTRRYGGTGLGLAISKQLAEMMGGHIGVESESGKGSRFWFILKLKKQSRDESISRIQFNDLRGVRILIVDDNSTNRNILHDQIISWGMSNGSAEDGRKALELLTAAAKRGEPYDLAVVDMNMPGMNGIELARAIKGDPLIASVRLIMLTSVGYFGDYDDALNSGFLSYLTKPVRQSQLYNSLLNVMNEPAEIISQKKSKDDEQDKKSWHFHGTILLAEDNLVNQEVTRGFLESLGCRIDIVNNGREAVEALKRELYDVVFMDCQMPEMDGFDATRVIREQEKDDNRQHVPVIALTAHAMEGDREECLAAGMDDYLSKPFTYEQLREKLERWMGEELHATALDQKILENIRSLQKDGEPSLMDKIITIYLQTTPKLLQDLREAVAASDAQAMRKAAHSLKSSSANVGAMKLSDIFKDVEVIGRTGSIQGAAALLKEIESEFQQVEKSLMLEMQGRPS